MKNILSPSMLSIDFANMGRDLIDVTNAGADTIHVDVMDGAFVPNISFGVPVMKYVRKTLPDATLDVHMMVNEPTRYLDDFVNAGADIITVHYEACSDLKSDIEKIRKSGVKVGLSIKPATPVSVLEDYIDDVDMVLIMSVEPGFGGQKFNPDALRKISETRAMAEKHGKDLDIEVDGGIGTGNLATVLEAGANVIVAGSAIFGGDIEKNVKDFLEIMA